MFKKLRTKHSYKQSHEALLSVINAIQSDIFAVGDKLRKVEAERNHWRDSYKELTEKVGYPFDGSEPDSNLIRHAQTELSLVGLYDEDSDYGGMIGRSTEDLIRVFAMQGHSGFSASWVMDLFTKLASHESLTPLTSNPDEWVDVSEASGRPLWQNKRCPSAFSENGGATYYLLDESVYDEETGVHIRTYYTPGYEKPPEILDNSEILAEALT